MWYSLLRNQKKLIEILTFRLIRFLVKTVIFLGVAAILVLGYLGFVPGLSALFGSDKPRDLGVRYAQADYDSFAAKSGISVSELPAGLPPDQSLRFSGKTQIRQDFTEAELTANFNHGKWKYFPFSDGQIKIGPNGTVELSAILHKDRLVGFAQAKNLPQEALAKVEDYLKYLPANPPIYLRGTASVRDNRVTLNVQELRVGKLAAPSALLGGAGGEAGAQFLQTWIASVPNFQINSLTFGSGKMHFEGTYPAEKAVSAN